MNNNPEPLKILFVDDEPHILQALRRVFLDEPYQVLCATSGKEGLEILGSSDIAVIVSDQRMSQMSGAEFLQRARQISPDSGRIVLTGHAETELAVDAINKGGAQRYITKPWNQAELISAVRTATEGYRLVRQNRYLTNLTNRQNEQLKAWNSELELHVQRQTIELTYKNRELFELNQKIERNFRRFMVTISNLIELRDPNIASHSNNVAAVSVEIARKVHVPDNEIQNIAIAAQLHDIGKIGIPDSILLKDIASLAPFEIALYQKHPILGQSAIDTFPQAAILVRHHHEAYNGTGFPDNLKARDIPLGARIITIADTLDRLLSTHSLDRALAHLKLLSGSRTDPTLLAPLTEISRQRAELFSAIQNVEEELHPDELQPGMVLSRDVRSGTGLLLLNKGVALNPRRIESLRRYYLLDTPASGVYVSRKN